MSPLTTTILQIFLLLLVPPTNAYNYNSNNRNIRKGCRRNADCPRGYGYKRSYDSCYSFTGTTASYMSALDNCMQDGAHFFVPNDEQEFDDVMQDADQGKTYWLGLQDWARRGAGSGNGTWAFAGAPVASDPDGIWQWMDGSLPSIGPNITANGSYYADKSTPWLRWQSRPTSANFVAALRYISNSWSVTPGTTFSTKYSYICEYSMACMTCPNNFRQYLDSCYSLSATKVTYPAAISGCASKSTGAKLWSPKTEEELIYARMQTNNLGIAVWAGLDHLNGSWKWQDNSAAISPSDALDVYGGQPNGTAFVVVPDTTSSASAFYDGWAGWLAVSGSGSGATNGQACEVSATGEYDSDNSATSSYYYYSSQYSSQTTSRVPTTTTASTTASTTSTRQVSTSSSRLPSTTALSTTTSTRPVSSSSQTTSRVATTTTASTTSTRQVSTSQTTSRVASTTAASTSSTRQVTTSSSLPLTTASLTTVHASTASTRQVSTSQTTSRVATTTTASTTSTRQVSTSQTTSRMATTTTASTSSTRQVTTSSSLPLTTTSSTAFVHVSTASTRQVSTSQTTSRVATTTTASTTSTGQLTTSNSAPSTTASLSTAHSTTVSSTTVSASTASTRQVSSSQTTSRAPTTTAASTTSTRQVTTASSTTASATTSSTLTSSTPASLTATPSTKAPSTTTSSATVSSTTTSSTTVSTSTNSTMQVTTSSRLPSTPASSTTIPLTTVPTSNSLARPVSSSSTPASKCGNGILDIPETCDDGNGQNGDGCSSHCTLEVVDRNLDIYIAVDTSFNVPLMQLPKVKNFVKTLMGQLKFTTDGGQVQLGLIDFGGRTAGYNASPMANCGQLTASTSISFVDSMLYFGNHGNLSNALNRIIDPLTMSTSDGGRADAANVALIVTASPAPDMQLLEDQLSSLASLGRHIYVMAIGNKLKKKQLGRLVKWGGAYDQVKQFDQLPANVYRIIDYLLNIS